MSVGFIDNDTIVEAINFHEDTVNRRSVGRIKELLLSGEIKIPQPWEATQEVHDIMRKKYIP